jgi:hypothetical protein
MQAPGYTGSGLDRTLASETLHLPSAIGGLDVTIPANVKHDTPGLHRRNSR